MRKTDWKEHDTRNVKHPAQKKNVLFFFQSTMCRVKRIPKRNTSENDIVDFCVETRQLSTQIERSMYTVKKKTTFFKTLRTPPKCPCRTQFFCFFEKYLEKNKLCHEH